MHILVDGVHYELIQATQCTRSAFLAIHFPGYISLIYAILHTNAWLSAGVHTLAKKLF